MKLHLQTGDEYLVRSYSDLEIQINNETYLNSLILRPNGVIGSWPPNHFDELAEEHFNQLAALSPELIVLGTGSSMRFPDPRLTKSITDQSIGLEIMDTYAACRTYNILAGEGRDVVAAFILETR